eukprot:Opistho-1_new@102813
MSGAAVKGRARTDPDAESDGTVSSPGAADRPAIDLRPSTRGEGDDDVVTAAHALTSDAAGVDDKGTRHKSQSLKSGSPPAGVSTVTGESPLKQGQDGVPADASQRKSPAPASQKEDPASAASKSPKPGADAPPATDIAQSGPTAGADRPFVCERCQRVFRLKHHLARHVKAPYSCTFSEAVMNGTSIPDAKRMRDAALALQAPSQRAKGRGQGKKKSSAQGKQGRKRKAGASDDDGSPRSDGDGDRRAFVYARPDTNRAGAFMPALSSVSGREQGIASGGNSGYAADVWPPRGVGWGVDGHYGGAGGPYASYAPSRGADWQPGVPGYGFHVGQMQPGEWGHGSMATQPYAPSAGPSHPFFGYQGPGYSHAPYAPPRPPLPPLTAAQYQPLLPHLAMAPQQQAPSHFHQGYPMHPQVQPQHTYGPAASASYYAARQPYSMSATYDGHVPAEAAARGPPLAPFDSAVRHIGGGPMAGEIGEAPQGAPGYADAPSTARPLPFHAHEPAAAAAGATESVPSRLYGQRQFPALSVALPSDDRDGANDRDLGRLPAAGMDRGSIAYHPQLMARYSQPAVRTPRDASVGAGAVSDGGGGGGCAGSGGGSGVLLGGPPAPGPAPRHVTD